jgi:hypothetical protein
MTKTNRPASELLLPRNLLQSASSEIQSNQNHLLVFFHACAEVPHQVGPFHPGPGLRLPRRRAYINTYIHPLASPPPSVSQSLSLAPAPKASYDRRPVPSSLGLSFDLPDPDPLSPISDRARPSRCACVSMGNTPSCIPLAPAGGGGASSSSSAAATTTKVIHADGAVTRLARPVRASELMLEHPGQFVCDPRRLAVGCRVPGVAAAELLQPRRAYFLLPMDMLYSVLTDEEMAALSESHSHAASSWKRIAAAARRHHGRLRRSGKDEACGGGARVCPMLGLLETGGLGADNSKRELRASLAGKSGGLRRHRSWQPVLDTIEEVP